MKIKHWQGYGFVEATKFMRSSDTLVVKVKGNHEYGIDRSCDTMDVFDWLVKRFDKTHKSWTDIDIVVFNYCADEYDAKRGEMVECGIYTIRFRNGGDYTAIG